MIFKSMVGRFLKVLLILGTSVLAGAQTQAGERALLPQRGGEKYWLLVDEFADRAIPKNDNRCPLRPSAGRD